MSGIRADVIGKVPFENTRHIHVSHGSRLKCLRENISSFSHDSSRPHNPLGLVNSTVESVVAVVDVRERDDMAEIRWRVVVMAKKMSA